MLQICNSHIAEAKFCFPKHDYDRLNKSKIYFVNKCLDFENVARYFNQESNLNKYNYLDYELEFDEEYQLNTKYMKKEYDKNQMSKLAES